MRPTLTPEVVQALAQSFRNQAVVVWLYLWTRADFKTSKTWPSLRTIGTALGIRPENVLREIRILETEGWLVVQKGRSTNTYDVTVPKSVDAVLTTPVPQSVYPAVTTPVPSGDNPPSPDVTGPSEQYQEHNHKPQKRSTSKVFDPSSMDLPFQSERFTQTWGDFCQHRLSLKCRLSELAATRILNKCKSWGEEIAITALDQSIESGWKTIYEPKGNGKVPRSTIPKEPPFVDTVGSRKTSR